MHQDSREVDTFEGSLTTLRLMTLQDKMVMDILFYHCSNKPTWGGNQITCRGKSHNTMHGLLGICVNKIFGY